MNKNRLYESIMSSVAIEVKKALNESSKAEARKDCIDYVKDSLVNLFDCGDDEMTNEYYLGLVNEDSDTIENVIEYLYDHDDDNYIGKYMEAFDIDFVDEVLQNLIIRHFKHSYIVFKNRQLH